MLKNNQVQKIDNNSKKAFIYSHAFGARSKTFNSMVNAFADYNHYLIDYREPDAGEKAPTFTEYLEFLNTVINGCIETEIILVGHSFGGGLSISCSQSKKVSKMILLAPLNPWQIPDIKALKRSFFPQTTNDLDLGWKTLIYDWKQIVSSLLYTKNKDKQLQKELAAAWWKWKLLKSTLNTEFYKTLKQHYYDANVPILLICGKEDKIVPAKSFWNIKSANSLVEGLLIENCGHAPLFEKRTIVLKKIKEFINE